MCFWEVQKLIESGFLLAICSRDTWWYVRIHEAIEPCSEWFFVWLEKRKLLKRSGWCGWNYCCFSSIFLFCHETRKRKQTQRHTLLINVRFFSWISIRQYTNILVFWRKEWAETWKRKKEEKLPIRGNFALGLRNVRKWKWKRRLIDIYGRWCGLCGKGTHRSRRDPKSWVRWRWLPILLPDTNQRSRCFSDGGASCKQPFLQQYTCFPYLCLSKCLVLNAAPMDILVCILRSTRSLALFGLYRSAGNLSIWIVMFASFLEILMTCGNPSFRVLV